MDKVLGNEKNQSLLNYFRLKKYPKKLIFLTNKDQIKKQIFSLGTHPEIVELLWYKYAKNFPLKCQVILFGRPVLINPISGIIFGFAEGTNPPALRLPKKDIAELLEKGGLRSLSDMDSVYADANNFGNDWAYCFSFIEGIDKYFISAYNYSK